MSEKDQPDTGPVLTGYLGEIALTSANFAHKNWAFCQGQLISIPNNLALYHLLGTTFGGDGRSTFALPDLRGRVIMGSDTTYAPGAIGGHSSHVLTQDQMPKHTHPFSPPDYNNTTPGGFEIAVDNDEAASTSPQAEYLSVGNTKSYIPEAESYLGGSISGVTGSVSVNMNTYNTGSGQPIDNHQPCLGLNFIICIEGVTPKV